MRLRESEETTRERGLSDFQTFLNRDFHKSPSSRSKRRRDGAGEERSDLFEASEKWFGLGFEKEKRFWFWF